MLRRDWSHSRVLQSEETKRSATRRDPIILGSAAVAEREISETRVRRFATKNGHTRDYIFVVGPFTSNQRREYTFYIVV